jgi:hypothetical protein
VPGARTILALDFAGTPVGDFPTGLRLLQGNLEVADKNGMHMLRASSPSEFVIRLPEVLPANFTLEFDLIPKACCNPVDLMVEGVISGSRSPVSAQIEWDAEHFAVVGGNPVMFQMDMPAVIAAALPSQMTHVAMSVEGETIRGYTNGQRLYTLTGRKFVRGTLLRVSLGGQDDDKYAVHLARVRVADLATAIVASNAPQAGPRSVSAMPTQPNAGSAPAASGAVLVPAATATAVAGPPTSPTTVAGPSSLGSRPSGSPAVSAGPAPTGFAVSASTPATVTFGWDPASGATDYTLLRTAGVGQPWVRVNPSPITSVSYTDANALDHRVTYTYRLQANYGGNPPGYADLNVSLPAPQDPTGFTGIATLPASVHLSWQPVPGASAYLLNGPGLAGTTVNGTSFVVGTAPGGNNVYRVASVYGAAGVLTPAASWPAVTVRVAPTPILPYLSLVNGPGNPTLEAQHNRLKGICWDNDDGWSWGCRPADDSYRPSLKDIFNFWGAATKFRNAIPVSDVLSETVTFSDVADLGFGRRVWCGLTGGGYLCLASSHGPDGAGANHAQQNADAAALNHGSRSYTVISRERAKFGGKMYFYQFTYPNGVDPTTTEPDPVRRFDAQLRNSLPTVNNSAVPSKLDSQGQKFAPHVCLSCHGGRFNPADNSVIDGRLLPIDPSRVVFSTLPGATRADQEMKIQDINRSVYDAGTPLVQEYVSKMYGGNWSLPARDDIVPAGWSGQQNLWNTVVRPYCIMCHMAQLGPLAFASFNDMMSVKDRVRKSVCTDGTMPHSEVTFRQFWARTDSSSLADQLVTALGFQSCP